MKTPDLYLAALITAALAFCSHSGFAENLSAVPDTLNLEEVVEEKNDTLEYELVIFDPAFEDWFQRVRRPKSFYEESYLKRWNEELVHQWNNPGHIPVRRECMPETYLEYDKDADYGMELEYRLFYFFRYMHEHCGLFPVTPGRW